MIERESETLVVFCDGCSEDYDTETQNFSEAIAKIKEAGWRIVRNKDDTEWVHFCPSCRDSLEL